MNIKDKVLKISEIIRKNQLFAMLFAVILIALWFKGRYFIGLVRWDSFRYCENAYDIINGSFVNYDNFFGVYRLALTIPLIVFFKLFGVLEFSATLVPIMYSLGTIIMTFFIGKELFGRKTGFLAALLLSMFTMEVLLSTQLLPDVILPFFYALSIFGFIKGERSEGKWKKIHFLFSGFWVQAGFFAREISFVLLGFYVVFILLCRRRKWKEYLYILYGFVLTGIAGFIVVWIMFGSPLKGINSIFSIISNGMFSMGRIIQSLKNTDMGFMSIMFSDKKYSSYYIPIFVVTGLLLAFRRKQTALVLTWFLFLYLYMEFINPIISLKHGRYLMILNLPGVIMLGYFLDELWKKKAWLKWLVVILLVVMGLRQCELLGTYHHHQKAVAYLFREPCEYVSNLPEKEIYFSDWQPRFNMFLKYRTPYRHGISKGMPERAEVDKYFGEHNIWMDKSNVRKLYKIRDAYIIWSPTKGRKSGINYFIPEDWEVLKEFRKYNNWRGRDTVIYYAPDRHVETNPERLFEAGKSLYEKKEYLKAYKKFRLAVVFNGNFREARKMAETARLKLKEKGYRGKEMDVALLYNGTSVVKAWKFFAVPNSLEAAIDGREDGGVDYAATIKGFLPNEFVLDFNQERTISFIEIEWYNSRLRALDWTIEYFNGNKWMKLIEEKDWQPNAREDTGILYKHRFPEPVKAKEIRMIVTGTANEKRMAISRFSIDYSEDDSF